ncbi:monovalent cation/H(+) antiporter subunit G [Streptomyces sp. AJS327]|uniref:monovalent cation/H(+) antiporter subunit G n=1 Tax=Streptomyces sp. AJS327 TaxID=2545265 RepID=UPI0015E03FA5|nr:monovalent cation/H(+) antiporter subunit G [Streptomyces sp. AJS327]MBA0050386.1 monovalent cation/H(+) antiporter subunit G [Streptomyces sp. AJS327]
MSWTDVAEWTGALFMLAGALLCLLAGIGLVRLPDVLTRMHAATKPQAFGLLLVLIGVGLWLRTPLDLGTLVLVGVFQLLTSPVAAHMVGRAGYRTGQLDHSTITTDELAEAFRESSDRREVPLPPEPPSGIVPEDDGPR